MNLEHLLPVTSGALLDASDFAAINQLSLTRLNELIAHAGHEHYEPAVTVGSARSQVISLINLGHLSALSIYGPRQYA
jgi:hypothetical protein